jgi:murein DD-endopeptidase MepM/ murein hydrolase activator NlpD
VVRALQNVRQSTVFGRRKEPHTVIIARGDDIRHFTVRPWLAALAGSVLAAVAVGYLLATTYLVLRDDLIGASIARQARLQHAYEDRIAALRAQVDRITSRQLLDQQLMETKVSELIARQTQLTRRHGRLDPILQRVGSDLPESAPVPQPAVEAPAIENRVDAAPAKADLGVMAFWSARTGREVVSNADRADSLFAEINNSLRSIEEEQLSRVNTLAEEVDKTADTIAEALEQAGFAVDVPDAETGIGGPYVAVDDRVMFETRVEQLDEALARLETIKKTAQQLPIHNPAPGYSISSSFGVRRDPLLGTPALHAGMDFRVPYGIPVRAAGAGKVISAGWNGGYGRMVEVQHPDGLTTRYAHLSKISVVEGESLQRGSIVGKVGSSGRSTGPHLHYEVRRNGTALDPLKFIRAGRKVASLM